MTVSSATAYDSVLLVSFGGPESPSDVEPFLTNVAADGRSPPSASPRWRSNINTSAA